MARPLPTRSEILRSLAEEERPLHASELAARLAVAPGSRRAFGELLEQLAYEGTLSSLPGRRYRALDEVERPEGWEGALSMNPRGFGFVNVAGRDDVYIPPDAIGGALHGDTIRLEIVARSPRGLEGRVASIVARRNPRVSGIFRKRRKSAWLEPDDVRIRGPIVIGGASPDGEDGDVAVALITRFPEHPRENPEGELLGVLGPPGDPRTEVEKILLREGIPEGHPEEAIHEAAARMAELSPPSIEGREDLRDFAFLTIDPVDARDHDDAVFAARTRDGYRAVIAIADVSEFVLPGGALDEAASSRSFTTYLPDRALPMLPRVLAADQCSLLPKKDRYALCAIVDLDQNAKVRRSHVVEAVIHARALITYEDAARVLGYMQGELRDPAARQYAAQLQVLDEIAKKLRAARLRQGALDMDLPEPKVELDPETKSPLSITARAKDPGVKAAYQLVEEFMLLANERVARFLSGQESPAVYRVHAPPDEDRIEQLAGAAEQLGVPFDVEALQNDGPVALSRWLASVAGQPNARVLEMLLLRSMKQAQYDIVNIGHFGLALDSYVHFTSPIRRYPDLLVHRLVKHLVRGGKPDNSPPAVEDLRNKASAASRLERTVMQVEREVVDLYRCLYMQGFVGDEYDARVSGISGSGVYASIESPFVDVLVRFEALGPDRYEATEDGLGVFGARSGERIQLGDRLRVAIEDVALERRTVYARRLASLVELPLGELSTDERPMRGRSKRASAVAKARGEAGRRKPGRTKSGAAKALKAARPERGRKKARKASASPASKGAGSRKKPSTSRKPTSKRPKAGRRR
jgi:ribonuclease R